MDKVIKKRPQTYQDIFGEDYDPGKPTLNERAKDLLLDQLVPFHNHPFKLYEGQRFNEMVESIKNFGVIVPIVVQKKGLKYQILSGHNRVNAAREAGLNEVPTIIKEGLTEEEATLIVTETNLMQRSFGDLVHSERATVIATRHEALKNQGIRTDLLKEIESLSGSKSSTSCPTGTKLDSKKEVGSDFDLSSRTVARYLRINQLSEPLKNMVDDGKIAMRAGVDLSYLSREKQEMIDAIVSEDTFKVDMKKAAMIREKEDEGKLDWKMAKSIITGEAMKDPNKEKPMKLSPKFYNKYFSKNTDFKEMETIIGKALDLYYQQEKNQSVDMEEEGEEELG